MQSRAFRSSGFALLEALVALLVGAFAIFAIVKLQGFILQASGQSTARSEAVTLAQAKLEELRAGAVTKTQFANLPVAQTCDTVSGASATNASFSRCWVSAALGTLDAKTLSVTVTWTDSTNATQTVVVQAVMSWDDVLGQAIFARPPTGSMIAPVGQAQKGSGQYTPIPTGAVQNADGTYTYTRADSRRELLDANGNILLYLEPRNNAPQAFVVISGNVYFDLANKTFLPDPSTVKVRLSSEGTCIETGKNGGRVQDLATVSGSGSGALSYGYYSYNCYVGPGWYGNVGVTVSDSVSGNTSNPTVCLGDPAFNSGVSDGTLISAHSLPATSRTYRGFRSASSTFISTGVAGGSNYPTSGRPLPSAYPSYYPGVTAGTSADAFNHHFLLTRITGQTKCADRMAGGVFLKNAGKYFCINPHDSTDQPVCPSIWPNFESEVGSGGGGGTVTYPLNVTVQGGGAVTAPTVGIDCGTLCTASVAGGTSVTLTATPNAGQLFTGWSGDCTGTASTCTVTMSASRTVGAQFQALPSYTLAVAKAGSGTGTVTSSPGSINCGSTCSGSFTSGTSVTLTATPDASQTFAGWTGGGCGAAATCTVTMSSDVSVTATFNNVAPTTSTLTVTKAGAGASTSSVSSSPAGISCGATCSATYANGTSVTLTAAPASGYTVTWSGACTGSASTCTVTMNAAQAVTATFNAITYTLSVTKTGTGTVTSNVGGISCGSTCSASIASGTSVTLTAAAGSGQTFSGWGGACSGSAATCTVTINAATSVSATFTATTCTTPVSGSLKDKGDDILGPVIAGTTTSAGSCSKPNNSTANYDCTLTAPAGTAVTLTAQNKDKGVVTNYTVSMTTSCTPQQVNF